MGTSVERRRKFDWICNVVKVVSTLVLTFEGSIQKVDPIKISTFWKPEVELASNWALPLIALSAISGLTAESIARLYGRYWEWQMIQFQLDELSDAVFVGEEYKDMGAHRVTLFRMKKFHLCWPVVHIRPKFLVRGWWAGWLVQVCRSGHITQNKRTCFYAPDNSDESEGVAGMAWRSKKAILVENLPSVHSKSGYQKIAEYSGCTWVSPEWIRRSLKNSTLPQSIMPRSMFGVAVETNSGRWGVLVIDSRQKTILAEEHLVRLCTPICKNLSNIVDRV